MRDALVPFRPLPGDVARRVPGLRADARRRVRAGARGGGRDGLPRAGAPDALGPLELLDAAGAQGPHVPVPDLPAAALPPPAAVPARPEGRRRARGRSPLRPGVQPVLVYSVVILLLAVDGPDADAPAVGRRGVRVH